MLDTAEAYGLRFLYPARDDTIGASLRDHGEFARPESDLICAYLAASPGAFVDVGANIGAICLPVAKAHPGLEVIAIEAHRGLHGVLSANALNNGLYNVQPWHAAAGAQASIVQFPAHPLSAKGNFGALKVGLADHRTEGVQMVTLDDRAPPHTRFIKIDVEGFEPEVLKGARATIATTRPAWFLEANAENDALARQTMATFLAAGYRLYWFFAPFVTPRAFGAHIQQLRGDTNFLALPEGFENLWDLKEITTPDAPRPTSVDAYGYMARYR